MAWLLNLSYAVLLAVTFCIAPNQPASAQGFGCTPDAAWRRVRSTYPIHAQTIAMCEDRSNGDAVVVVTEPPHHIVRSKAGAIVQSLFTSKVKAVNVRRQPLGYDGWAEDLVISVSTQGAAGMATLREDMALLAQLTFGSLYKAEVEDIAGMTPAPWWQAPAALEIRAEELHAWLLGPSAEPLVTHEGGTRATLAARIGRLETGVYYTATPGLVVGLVGSGSSSQLNEQLEDLRRFALDSDVFLGAIKIGSNRVALIGRERSTPVTSMQPLRLETILLLASVRTSQLSQSYERSRPFAGKLLTDAGELFGWDWGPILLSDQLNDTEFGSLLNFTDNMLKGWSESGKIQYKGFAHPYPDRYPFSSTGAMRTLETRELTYNWNTAGVGYITRVSDADIFAVRNSGSLPVSYFPEGSQSDAVTKAKLIKAEDDAYRYFSSLRNPLLARAVQYAALYQVFQAFDVRARAPHDPAAKSAAFGNVENLLYQQTMSTLESLAQASPLALNSSLSPYPNKYMLLFQAYAQFGDEGRSWQTAIPPQYETSVREMQATTREQFAAMAATVRQLDASVPNWRQQYARSVAYGYELPSTLQGKVEDLRRRAFPQAQSLEGVRKAVVEAGERQPEAWIRTPSIVVSRGESRGGVGGHNIGGNATKVVVDRNVTKGSVEVSGTYESGRVIRVSPEDAAQSRDLVRAFDREVGLYDRNIGNGRRLLEAKLRETPIQPQPPRAMTAALDLRASATRTVRGAEPSPRTLQVGIRNVRQSDLGARAAASPGEFNVIVSRNADGTFLITRTAPPPAFVTAPNPTSLLSALPRELRLATVGPPPITHARIGLGGIFEADISRFVTQLEQRSNAVAGAGGKPPYGGNRRPLSFADAPEPGRGWGEGRPPRPPEDGMFTKAWDQVMGVVGRRSTRVHHVEGDPKLLKTVPNWSTAEVRVLDANSVLLFDSPKFPGVSHVIEIKVSHTTAGGPQKFVMWLKTWFKDNLATARADKLNEEIRSLLRTNPALDAEGAAARIKALIKDDFQAGDTWFHIDLEGAGSVTVVDARPSPGPEHHG